MSVNSEIVESGLELLKTVHGFKCDDLLGKGTYGSVYKIKSSEKGTFAAKIVERRVVNQLELKEWPAFNNSCVLRLLQAFVDVDEYVIFLTDLMQTNLFSRLQSREFRDDPKAPERCRQYSRQVLFGMSYLHGRNLCHLDLRAENVFLSSDDRAVVADFSGLCHADELKKFCPLPHSLRPPEMLVGRKRVQPLPIDLWAYGLLVANMYLGKGYYASTVKNAKAGTLDSAIQYTSLYQCPAYVAKFAKETYPKSPVCAKDQKNLISLIHSFLQLDPKDRTTTEGGLDHEFFRTQRRPQEEKSGSSAQASPVAMAVPKAASEKEDVVGGGKIARSTETEEERKRRRSVWKKFKMRLKKLRLQLIMQKLETVRGKPASGQ